MITIQISIKTKDLKSFRIIDFRKKQEGDRSALTRTSGMVHREEPLLAIYKMGFDARR